MIREIYQYCYAIYKRYHPICDRCLDVNQISTPLSFWTYMINRKGKLVYCVRCWNWIHLKKWKCKKCHISGTHRDTHSSKQMTCPSCCDLVKLECK